MRGKASLASRLLCVLLLLVVARTAAAGGIIYVDADATGTNNGSSWENAYIYLQDALNDAETAEKPVEIRVAQGIYTPDQGDGPKPGDKQASFRLINDVAIIGGFAGVGEKNTNTRDIESYETFLSGNLNTDDDPENRENSYHVVIGSYTDQTAILDGFTVTGGNASGYSNPDHYGGGMYNYQGSPVVTRCTFKLNRANIDGGAICNRESNPVLERCSFAENSAQSSGGAIYNSNSSPFIEDCVFTQNSALRSQGGAIYNRESSLEVVGCRFEFNTVKTGSGGGICNRYSNLKLVACTFSKNSAWLGGGIYSSHCSVIIANSLFTGNFAFPLQQTSNSNMQSSSLIPFTGRGGGMYYVSDEGSVLINCTVTGNRAFYSGSGIYNSNNERLGIRNCVLWDNQILSVSQTSDQISGGKPLIVYNCIQDWHNSSNGNICHDPLFAKPGYWDPKGTLDDTSDDFWVDGDYHLKSQAGRWDPVNESWVVDDVTSPCIDAGDPNSPVAFEPFPNGSIINMGAYGGTAEASMSLSGLHAKYGGGTGEPNNPYLIYTAEHLNTIGTESNDWDKHFKLMADIDLSGYTGTDFNVIGIGFMTAFSGVFDGNGHTISNFNYSSTGENLIGIFSYIDGPNAHISNLGLIDPNVDCETNFGVGSLAGLVGIGTITNCHVIGGNVTGKQQVGGLIGICDGIITDCYAVVDSVIAEVGAGVFVGDNGGSIIDCYSTGNITGLDYIGGLVGTNVGSIVDCYSDAGVEGRSNVGGLLGWNWGTLKNCSSTSSVTGTYSTGGLVGENRGSVINCYCSCTLYAQNQVGGIVGINDGIVTASYSSANIHGRNEIGGLVGYNTDDGEIVNCYATGDVIGQRYVGGLVGNNATANPHAGEILSGTIRNCYSVTLVSGDQNVGGLIGHFGEDGVSGSFWDIEASGLTTSDGGVGKTTLEMQDLNTFIDAGWDFVGSPGGPGDIWAEPEGGGYPVLMWQLSLQPELPAFSGGSGEPDDPYLISTDDELNSIGHNPRLMNAHFKLVNDIDITGVDFFIIASQYHPFQGTFDGNDHTISNFSYTSPEAKSIGLFGYVSNGRIKNLGLIDPNVHVDKGDFHGCLVGRLGTGTITHCYVESGSVTGQDELGGLVGENGSSGVIMNCYFTGEANGKENVGGLVGQNHGSITASYSYANVEGQTAVGGLVGRCSFGETVNCYARGDVVGQSYVGGLVGSNGSKSSHYSGTILNCYSASAILRGPQKGGLLGVDWGGEWAGVVNNCFWDIETSGLTTSYGGEGKTTAEMQTASTFLNAGWDFADETTNGTEDIWWILEGQDYPRLWWESTEDHLFEK
jgi:predicted outer membrane repeat protein